MSPASASDAPQGMQRKLVAGIVWALVPNLLVKPFWLLGIEVGVQNAVGAQEYGFYFALFNLAYIFNILLDLGITNYNTRHIARFPHRVQSHLSGILCSKLLLLGLYLVVTFTVGLLLGYDARQFRLLCWLTLNQFLNSLILYLRSNLEGLLLFRADSLLSVLDRVLMIVICGCLLWLPGGGGEAPFRIEWFVYAQTAAYLVATAVALGVVVRHTGWRRLRWSWPFTLSVLRRSLPFALLVLLMASYNRLDPILLRQLLPSGCGDGQAGIYAAAFRMLDALTMVGYLVSVPLLPVYSRLLRREAGDELRDVTRLVSSLMLVFSVGAAVTLASLSQPLMALFYQADTAAIARVFGVLIFGLIPVTGTYIFGTLLTANGNLRQLNTLAALSVVLSVVANVCLIPRFAAVGSAWASLGVQTFMAVAQTALACRLFRLRPSGGYVLRLVGYVVAVVVANGLCASLPMWWHLAVVVTVCVAVSALLRLLPLRELRTLLPSASAEAD